MVGLRKSDLSFTPKDDGGVHTQCEARRQIACDQRHQSEYGRDARKHGDIIRTYPDQKTLYNARQRKSPSQSKAQAETDHNEAFFEYHAENIPRLCAKRDPDPDFAEALTYGSRNNPVNAHESKHKSEKAEAAGDRGGEPKRQQTIQRIERLSHSSDVKNRQIGRAASDYVQQFGNHNVRSNTGLHL